MPSFTRIARGTRIWFPVGETPFWRRKSMSRLPVIRGMVRCRMRMQKFRPSTIPVRIVRTLRRHRNGLWTLPHGYKLERVFVVDFHKVTVGGVPPA